MDMDFQRSDALLMEVLQGSKTITRFLDAIFGFMRRNTDFYHIKRDEGDKIGFPKGMREVILFGAMERYDPDCCLNTISSETVMDVSGEVAPPAIKEITIESEEPYEPILKKDISTESKPRFAGNEYKNGAAFKNYCWSQTLKDVELNIHLPTNLRQAKLLCIDIKPLSIRVSSKSAPCETILEGTLSQRIKHNDVVWTIDKDKLLVSCDKAKEHWWDRLFESDDEIDTTKLGSECYVDDLPESSQVTIEKLRRHQIALDKQQNMPIISNPDQALTLERLRKAWDLDGSPFKGQPFDPSLV